MKRENRNLVKSIVLITQLGLNVLVTIFLSVWFGGWLDKWFGTGFFIILFLFLGILAAYRNAYFMTKAFYAKDRKREEQELAYFENLKKEREKAETKVLPTIESDSAEADMGYKHGKR